jgi:hypothetical protein
MPDPARGFFLLNFTRHSESPAPRASPGGRDAPEVYTTMADITVEHPSPCVKFTVIKLFRAKSIATFPQKATVSAKPFCGNGNRRVTIVTGELPATVT